MATLTGTGSLELLLFITLLLLVVANLEEPAQNIVSQFGYHSMEMDKHQLTFVP